MSNLTTQTTENLPNINHWINLKSHLFKTLMNGSNKNKVNENWKYPLIKSIALDVYFNIKKTN